MLIYLAFLNAVLLLSWFRSGLIFGGGDTGLPLYNPHLVTQITQYMWWGQQGTGYSYPGLISSFPMYFFLSIFQKIGFNPFALQVIFFGGVLVFASFGMYLTMKLLIKNRWISFLITLFYIINPYSMINVWHRGSYNGMVMLAILPWTLYLFYRGLTERKVKFSMLLVLLTPFFGYVFNTPAFIATWCFFIAVVWCFLFVLYAIPKKQKTFYIGYLLTFAILFVGINLWWLIPFFHVAPSNLFGTSTLGGNIGSLRGVSQYFTLPYAFRGIGTFYPINQQDWGTIYTNPFFDALSFIEFGFVVVSFFYSRKIKFFGFFLFLYLIAVFISKGTGVPFGDLITFAFSIFPYLSVFRNPFEKFGILIPFAESFLAGYGLYYIYTNSKSKLFKVGVLILLCGFLVYEWPFFTGNVFGNLSYSSSVKVPKEYDRVDDWFRKNGARNPRIFHLPFALGDGIIYKWEYGYWGLESSQLFFPGSSISHYLGFEFVDQQYKLLALSVRNHNLKMFESMLRKLAVNYIVIHKDVDFMAYREDTLQNIESFINTVPFLEKKATLGNIEIFKVRDKKEDLVALQTINNTVQVYGRTTNIPHLVSRDVHSAIYTAANQGIDFRPVKMGNSYLPEATINPFDIQINKKNVDKELPSVRFLPGSPFYLLIRLKENLAFLGKDEYSVLLLKIQFSNKRLVEASRLIDLGKINLAGEVLTDYMQGIKQIEPFVLEKIQTDITHYNSLDLYPLAQLFLRQEEVISQMNAKARGEDLKAVWDARDALNKLFLRSGLKSMFGTPVSLQKRTYRFNITSDGEYTLHLGKEWVDALVNRDEMGIDIDGQKVMTPLLVSDDAINTGTISLKKGEHEIGLPFGSYNIFPTEIKETQVGDKALISTSSANTDEFEIKTGLTRNYIDYSLNKFDPTYNYLVGFDYWTKYGSPPEIKFIQDTDALEKKMLNTVLQKETSQSYQYYWKSMSTVFGPNLFSNSMKIRILIDPWNDCTSINYTNKEICNNMNIYNRYNKESDVIIKNIKIQRFPSDNVILSNVAEDRVPEEKEIVHKKINPTKYTLNIAIAKPTVLVLRETFHDGWSLIDAEGKKVPAAHVLVDNYANGWILKSSLHGTYSIEFMPQKDKAIGFYIGVCIIIIGASMSYYLSAWNKKQKK